MTRMSECSFAVRMDRQGIVHRWMLDAPLCDPDYAVFVAIPVNRGWFPMREEPIITCLKCVALEASRRTCTGPSR